jgi:hypothetical protein
LDDAFVTKRQLYLETAGAITSALLAIYFLSGCDTISKYDEHAYGLQTSCLADVLKLLDAANTPYDQNLDQIKDVTLNMERAYEYDRSRPLNQIQTAQWKLIRGLFYRIVTLWKSEGTLRSAYITEKKLQMALAMDQVTQLETGKVHQ